MRVTGSKRKAKNCANIVSVRTTTSGTTIYFDRPMRARLITDTDEHGREKQHRIRDWSTVTIGRKHRSCLIFHHVYNPQTAIATIARLPWKSEDFKAQFDPCFFGYERSPKFSISSKQCESGLYAPRRRKTPIIDKMEDIDQSWAVIEIEAVSAVDGEWGTVVSTRLTTNRTVSSRVTCLGNPHGPCAVLRTLNSICRKIIKAGHKRILIQTADPTVLLALTYGVTLTTCAAGALEVLLSTIRAAEVRVHNEGFAHKRELYRFLTTKRNRS